MVDKTTKSEEIIETKKPVKKVEKPAEAKAGKRSHKAIKAEAAAEVKTEKKIAKQAEEAKAAPKHTPKKVRYSRSYQASLDQIDKDKLYSVEEAVKLLPLVSKVNFDATAELHVSLGIDPRQSDQFVRTSVVLPAGSGKNVRVAVIADDKASTAAKQAGAELTDSAKIISDIEKGKFDFDVLIATPQTMPQLGKHAKVLGPKGLMPSPKSGTVSADPAKTVVEIKKGRQEIKNDAQGIIHLSFGKLSFKEADLLTNAQAALTAIVKARPAAAKSTFVKAAYVSATMSPSIKLDPAKLTS